MPSIRRAALADLPAIRDIVERAYAPYVARIGRRPAPMDEDHAAQIAAGQADVVERDGAVAGVVVWWCEADHAFIDNVAVDPARRGEGIGGRLIAFVEREALARGLGEVRLYTHARMTENLAIYRHLGWNEFDRRSEHGFERVYLRKRLAGG